MILSYLIFTIYLVFVIKIKIKKYSKIIKCIYVIKTNDYKYPQVIFYRNIREIRFLILRHIKALKNPHNQITPTGKVF